MVFWTEMINFMEHYGLTRDKIGEDDDGNPIYESIDGFASWNAPASVAGFKLQRHSDHHCHGFRPYQILRHYDDVPCHPYEYLYMLFLAFIPPAFRYVVHPRIDAVNRAKKGIKVDGEEDQWCNSMPMSKADKKRDLVVKFTTFLGTAFMAWLTIQGGL